MKKPIEQIANDFSIGNFENVFPHLSDNIEWNIIGEKILSYCISEK